MSISGNPLRDFDGSGDLVSDEVIAIPLGAPYEVFPEFWPQKNNPTSIEVWTGANKTGTQFTEKSTAAGVSASGDYHVDYNRGGLVTTHATSSGDSLYITYFEIGTFSRVKHLNDIRNVVGSGDVNDDGGNVNLVSHANDDSIHQPNAGSGDVVGPSSATDHAVARYDQLSGRLLQNSSLLVDDDGNITSFGGQVAFPASQSASADANTLDDYEEGTWTVGLADAKTGGNESSTTGTGGYVKIGSVVSVWGSLFNIDTNGLTAGNVFHVTGLPFTSGAYISTFPIALDNITFASDDYCVVYMGDGEVTFSVRGISSGGPDISLTVSDIADDAGDLIFSLVYRV